MSIKMDKKAFRKRFWPNFLMSLLFWKGDMQAER